jgi:sensor domain CHASE-containing protein
MSIRRKLLLIHIVIFFSLLLTQFVSSRYLILQQFSQLEADDVKENTNRGINAISNEVKSLNEKLYDWSVWDDSYQFMSDHNQQFIDANLVEQGLVGLRINFMLFIDLKGNLFESKAVDLQSMKAISLDDSLKGIISNNPDLAKFSGVKDNHIGLIRISDRIVLLAARPIVTSDEQGPIRGTLIMGKNLDEQELAGIQSSNLLSLKLVNVNNISDDEFKLANSYLIENPNGVFINPIDDNKIAGYTYLRDLNNKPLMIIRTDIERNVFQHGLISGYLNVGSIIIIGLIFGVMLLVLVEKTISQRLEKLVTYAEDMTRHPSETGKIEVGGKDEISRVAVSLNSMVDKLKEYSSKLQQTNLELESKNQDLEAVNQAMTGREQQMMEQKTEIVRLNQEASKNQPTSTQSDQPVSAQ